MKSQLTGIEISKVNVLSADTEAVITISEWSTDNEEGYESYGPLLDN